MPNMVNVAPIVRYSRKLTLNPDNIPAATPLSVETFTVSGLKTDMLVLVNAPNLEAGVKVIAARVSAANTLELTFYNFSGADVNPASQTFYVVAL